jgi:hypothetical protein
MPITTELTPMSAAESMSAFMPGMSASQPSSPKRLAAVYLLARKDSNISLQVSLRAGKPEKWGGEMTRGEAGSRGLCSACGKARKGGSLCGRGMRPWRGTG